MNFVQLDVFHSYIETKGFIKARLFSNGFELYEIQDFQKYHFGGKTLFYLPVRMGVWNMKILQLDMLNS